MANRATDLLEQQEKEDYFNQHGMFAYLISWEWLNRWKIFTSYQKSNKQNSDDVLRELLPLHSRASTWNRFAEKFCPD